MRWPRLTALVLVLIALHPSPCAADCGCSEPGQVGKVVSVSDQRLVVDLGSRHGIEKGMRVAVIPLSALNHHPKVDKYIDCACGMGITAVVELDEVSESRSSGTIGRASAATKGDLVITTDLEPTHKRWFPGFPHQYRNIWDVCTRLRIALAIDVAILPEMILTYQMPAPVKLGVMIAPAFVGVSNETHAASTLAFTAAYSGRFFELGFGVGSYINNFDSERTLAFVQTIRIGAEHGMHLRVTNILVWDVGPTEWHERNWSRGLHYESTFGEIRVPVSNRIALFLEGGGGGGNTFTDWMRVTTGLYVTLRGNGGPGTIVLPVGIGGGFVSSWFNCDWEDDECWDREFDYGGFVINTGLDMRW